MSTHTILFYCEILEIIPKSSPNTNCVSITYHSIIPGQSSNPIAIDVKKSDMSVV